MTGTARKTHFAARALLGASFAAMLAGAGLMPAPASAQQSASAPEGSVQEIRIRKLEAEVRALQRQVFPGGDGTYFPRNDTTTAPGTSTGTQVGTPATTPVTDLLARMDAVETQIARLTAQNEDIQHRLRLLEGEHAPAAAPALAPAPAPAAAPLLPPPPPAAKPETGTAKPSAARIARVKAIIKPETGDAGEDEYTYGFKLWEAKFYPEAEQQLKLFVTNYPKHKRISYARNLLGRAYLDDNKPREAADWFLANYQANRKGDRAPDSLLYLVQSLVMLKDTSRACIALAEFTDTYKTEAAGRLKGQYDGARATVSCN